MSQLLEQESAKAEGAGQLAGKYLTFALGQESYGIAVRKIREIIRMIEVTAVPQMPAYVRGVVNLRGKIIPVIDLRRRFQMDAAETNERTCIVVVQVARQGGGTLQMGLVVDQVEEVLNIHAADLEEPPKFGAAVHEAYILGMAKIKEGVKTLLDIDRVIGEETLGEVAARAV